MQDLVANFSMLWNNIKKSRLAIIFIALLVSCSTKANIEESTDASELEPPTPELSQVKESEAAIQDEVGLAQNDDSAEAFYRELMAEYGENCYECAEELELELKDNPLPKSTAKETSPPQLNVIIALDSSGSMAENTNGESRMSAAKIAIAQFADDLPETAQVSLIAFGHEGSNSSVDKAVSCQGIETVYPLAAKDSERFQVAVDSFTPTGYTPLASTLELAEQNLTALNNENNQNIIYLVSDGEETCDGDPVAVAQRLKNSQAGLVINVIGFDVDNTAQQQLKAIAQAGGGQYFLAKDRTELQEVWQQNTIDLNRYKIGNVNNQNQIFLSSTNAGNKLFLCVTNKLNKEKLQVTNALNLLRIRKDPNAQHIDYAEQKMAQKREQVEKWRNDMTADLASNRDIAIEQLKQELQAVDRDY